MAIGEKLAAARRRKNYTQEQLAERLQVTRQTVSRWESETAYPETEKLIRLAEILEISLDDLLRSGTDRGKTDNNAKNPVTRLLLAAKGKVIRLQFKETEYLDVSGKLCMINHFDGCWMDVTFKKGKGTENRLVPVAAVSFIRFEKGDEKWKA